MANLANLANLDIEFLKMEVDKIYDSVDLIKEDKILKKFSEFNKNFPILMKNILSRKMSREEVYAMLETFSIAQKTFNDNIKLKTNN
jgi:hypothetical protein